MFSRVYSKLLKIKKILKSFISSLFTHPFSTNIILLKIIKKTVIGSYRIFTGEIEKNFIRVSVDNGPEEIKSRNLVENPDNDLYLNWSEITDNDNDMTVLTADEVTFQYNPLISVIVPIYNTPEKYLRLMIESVLKQKYKVWELCIVDDASTDMNPERIVREYMQDDPRIRFMRRSENGHISAASNSALSLATGEFITLLDHDDEITADALYWIVKELNEHPETDLIYTDEDKITEEGVCYSPIFKPDWNFYLFIGNNIINHLGLYRKNIVDQIGYFRTGFEGSQDYDLILRFISKITSDRIRHIPKILYHWRSIQGSVSGDIGAKLYAFVSAKKAIADYFWKKNIPVKVSDSLVFFLHKVEFLLPAGYPPVCVLIYGDNSEKLQSARSELQQMSNYPDYKIVTVLKCGCSDYKVEFSDSTFESFEKLSFPCLLNKLIRKNNDQYIMLVNSVLKQINSSWLIEMVSVMSNNDVGCCGASIFDKNNKMISGPGVLGLCSRILGTQYSGLQRGEFGYCGRAVLLQECSAVRHDAMMIKKSVFNILDGFDEKINSLFDVDFCIRSSEKGFKTLWNPFSEFIWQDDFAVYDENIEDVSAFKMKWNDTLLRDKYFNPNLSLNYSMPSLRENEKSIMEFDNEMV